MRVQATSICLNGRAYLITGKSDSGKSALALSLINQGATLIADDLTYIESGKAKAPAVYTGWMEVRGIGLISGFSVTKSAPVSAVFELVSQKNARLPESKVVQLEDNFVPLFQLWSKDAHLVDKVFVIDSLMAGQLKLELRKEKS